MRDLLKIEAILQRLDDDAGGGIEAVDQAAFGIQEHGAVGVVHDMNGR